MENSSDRETIQEIEEMTMKIEELLKKTKQLNEKWNLILKRMNIKDEAFIKKVYPKVQPGGIASGSQPSRK